MSEPGSKVQSEINLAGPKGPQGRMSSPQYTDYHMILDHELTQLGKSDAGTFGSLAFTFVGAAVGFMPASVDAFSKFIDKDPSKFSALEFGTIIALAVSLTAGINCMIIYLINSRQNSSLVKEIRSRQRMPILNTPDTQSISN